MGHRGTGQCREKRFRSQLAESCCLFSESCWCMSPRRGLGAKAQGTVLRKEKDLHGERQEN